MARPFWKSLSALAVTLAALAVAVFLSKNNLSVTNPPAIILLGVLFSAFYAGLGSGLISAAAACVYIAIMSSIPDQPFRYTQADFIHLLTWGGTLPLMAIMVGVLQRRSARQARAFQDDAILQAQIAERGRGENALRDSTLRLAGVVSAAMDAIITIQADQKIVDYNPAAEKMFHCSSADAIGQPIDRFIPSRFRAAHRKHVQEFGRTGVTNRAMGKLIPLKGLRADGEEFPLEASISQVHLGAQVLFTVILRDITERQRMEEDRARLAAIVESSHDAIFSKTLDGTITSWNKGAEKIYGFRADEMLGKSIAITFPPENSSELDQIMERVRRGERIEHYETVRVRKDGARIDVALSISSLADEEGTRVGASVIGRDITERRRAEEENRQLRVELDQRVLERTAQLQAANQELEAFSYSVSHDLRAPLRAMDGFSRILVEDFKAEVPAAAQRYLNLVRSNTVQMGQLVDDLLAFSRLSRQPLNKQTTAPVKLVRQVLNELRAEQAGRTVEINLGPLPSCEADPALLKQVWVNLLTNALKFTRSRDPARIEIGHIDEDGESHYFVKDNGVGFDKRYAEKLFGVFQRLHRAEEYEGTGVGLAIVQRIVHRHGGRVWAESELGQGAAFYFSLPTEPAMESVPEIETAGSLVDRAIELI